MSASDAGLKSPGNVVPADSWSLLRQHTPARIALGRVGSSLPTAELLHFASAHAQARDAVHVPLGVTALASSLQTDGWQPFTVSSRAPTREAYLRRPDWGRQLSESSAAQLQEYAASQDPSRTPDLVVVVADGLSALAAARHAVPLLGALKEALPDHLVLQVVIARLARVALADEVGEILHARAALILLGERPGLTSPDSLGAYLTFAPRRGRTDAERNCVSNIRPAGLAYAHAARRIAWLLQQALHRQLTGVGLKDDSEMALLNADAKPAA